jgi:general nucleoside transport system permease protein
MTEEKPKQPGVHYWLNQTWLSIRVPLAAIILALLVGAVILIFSGVNPLDAYQALFVGAFGETRYLLRTLEKATPLIFSGLAVAFGFKAGLFNIGAQGQLLLGAMTAALIGFMVTGLPPLIHIPLALLGGALTGALYGFIPGALKTYTGAHEVITTIMLNYVAINITDYLADGPFKDPEPANIVARTARIQDSAVIPTPQIDLTVGVLLALLLMIVFSVLVFAIFKKVTLGIKNKLLLFLIRLGLVVGLGIGLAQLLRVIAPRFYAQPVGFLPYNAIPFPIGFLIAILMAVVVWFILMRTTLGFEIRTVGLNPHAARYAGIKVKMIIILAMVISGFLAGMGGSIETQAVVGRYQPGFNTGLGFDGITVALLGRNHPLGVIPAALLIGAMQAGSNVMQFQAGVPSEIIGVIQALMLFFVAADMIVRWVIRAKARPGEVKIDLTSGWGKQ